MNVKSLIFQTAGSVGVAYYLAKTVYSGDKCTPGVSGKFLAISRKFALANTDFKSPADYNLISNDHEEQKKVLWNHNWDRRANEPAARRGVRRKLLFIRHGDYHKEKGPMKGSLNEKGIAQATWAGLRLKELVENGQHIDKIVVSTMPRARESFDAIKAVLNTDNIEIETSDLITEGYPCLPEPESSNKHPEYQVFQDSARIEAAFRNIFYRPSPEQKGPSFEVYICHANVIRYFVLRALQLPPEAWRRFNLGNASFTEICVSRDGKVYLNTVGERAHVKKHAANNALQSKL